MFGGLLAFLGIYAGSAAKAAKDNYDMKKITRTVDENGNVHYMDRLCNDYINGFIGLQDLVSFFKKMVALLNWLHFGYKISQNYQYPT